MSSGIRINIEELTPIPKKYLQALLCAASSNGQIARVKFLVSAGADPRGADDECLRVAAANGSLEVVQYLVSLGADIQSRDDDYNYAAATYGYMSLVWYLVSIGANICAIAFEIV